MFGINDNGFYSALVPILVKENWLFFLLSILLATPLFRRLSEKYQSGEGGAVGSLVNAAHLLFLAAGYAVSVLYLIRNSYAATFEF